MKKGLLVLFMVILAGCAVGPERYAGNAGALSAYTQGLSDRARYEQKKIENEAYRNGFNLGQPDISVYGAFQGGNFSGAFGYDSQPFGWCGSPVFLGLQKRRRPIW